MANYISRLLLLLLLLISNVADVSAQHDLLLNGNFEDINTCTEYNSECGVEAWFYMRDVKVQMLPEDSLYGNADHNSLGIFYNWVGFTSFSPIMGTVLPCHLQKDKRYTFKGILSVRLDNHLIFKPGVVLGDKFYVPKRPFAATLHPDTISSINQIGKSNFFSFEYDFVANGTERYLTFGSYIEEDTVAGKTLMDTKQPVLIVADNFQLIPETDSETVCLDYKLNKEIIYAYNYRHKAMDYSLYAKGDLGIQFNSPDSNLITRKETIVQKKTQLAGDTLKLGDVFFDFNKSDLKENATSMLQSFFSNRSGQRSIDSIFIEGHTDSIGTDENNLELSLHRCERIKDWLIQHKIITDEQVKIHPFGESRPIATNSTIEGRALNRRVELIVFDKARTD